MTRKQLSSLVLVLVGAFTLYAAPASAVGWLGGAYNWQAYNDCVGPASGSAPNVTNYSGYLGGGGGFETPSGLLKVFSGTETAGTNTSVTATLAAVNVAGSLGTGSNAGTDAHSMFDGIVNLGGSASYNSSGSDWSYEVVFSGLDPTKSYDFFYTANRNGASYDGNGSSSRWTKASIMGADTYDFASSAGVTQQSADVALMNGGYNTVRGDLVGWTGITAADGTFKILTQNVGAGGPGQPIKSYGLQGFAFGQRDGTTIPEPSSMLLLGVGIGVAGLISRKKKSRA